jgi:hypothetical protein
MAVAEAGLPCFRTSLHAHGFARAVCETCGDELKSRMSLGCSASNVRLTTSAGGPFVGAKACHNCYMPTCLGRGPALVRRHPPRAHHPR